MNKIENISCPNCSHQFDVEDVIASQLEKKYQQQFLQKSKELDQRVLDKQKILDGERKTFEEAKQRENELFTKKLNEKISLEKLQIQKKVHEDFEQKLKILEDENLQKKEENRALKAKELELLKKENDLKEKTEELQHNMEKQMLEKQQEIEEKARSKERASFELEKIKLLKQIEDNKKLAEEMKRKAEQGSMQMQGEVLELAIEELLKSNFPFDIIEEVPKGILGADIIQNVINRSQNKCGKIVYESKRTKNFDQKWIEKLKQDTLRVKGDISVLVTETMPKNIDSFDLFDGVWICSFKEVSSLAKVLREMLVNTQSVKLVQENKGDKMELLYHYLTSNDFVQKIKRITENYDAMILQLNSEKKAMFKIWSEREKRIWVVQENISAMFGDIKGIAGNTLSSVDVLELKPPKID